MEVIDIDLDNIPLSENTSSEPAKTETPSVSFGGGIELLMNEKKKSSSSSTKIGLEELDDLETELNDLSNTKTSYQGGDPNTTSSSANDGTSKTLSGISGLGSMFGGFMGGNTAKSASSSNENNNGGDTHDNDSTAIIAMPTLPSH